MLLAYAFMNFSVQTVTAFSSKRIHTLCDYSARSASVFMLTGFLQTKKS